MNRHPSRVLRRCSRGGCGRRARQEAGARPHALATYPNRPHPLVPRVVRENGTYHPTSLAPAQPRGILAATPSERSTR
jgi:hypothetical protein